jgi:hypothetical protein
VWLLAGAAAWSRRRRRVQPLLAAEHAAFLLVLISGFALMRALGWPVSHGRWLGVKIGLAALLLLPLEGMHAWVVHVWMRRGPRDLERAIGMDEMLRAIALPLLAVAVPLIVWLSVGKPF